MTTPSSPASQTTHPCWALVKEAFMVAGVTFLLAIPFVTLYTTKTMDGLAVKTRWPETIYLLIFVFVGRLLLGLIKRDFVLWPTILSFLIVIGLWLGFIPTGGIPVAFPILGFAVVALKGGYYFFQRSSYQKQWQQKTSALSSFFQHDYSQKWFLAIVLILLVLFPFSPFADRSNLDICILILTYIMLGWGLNITVGLAGLLDLGYVAFFAVGAYGCALMGQYWDFGFWVCLPIAGFLAAMFGLLLGFPVLRLRGDYFAIVTLGFGGIVRIIILNWVSFTGGPNGIGNIPKPTFFGLPMGPGAEGQTTFHNFFGLDYRPLDRIIFLYFIILALVLLTNLFTQRIRKLPIGRAWEALRENEIASRSLGINLRNTKLTAYSMGAMFAGFAGTFFATRLGFISPESFTFIESAMILAIVVLGGMGSQLGVVLATILLVGLPEAFRGLEDYRMLVFGAVMVLVMIWRPGGLLANRTPSILLSRFRKKEGGTP